MSKVAEYLQDHLRGDVSTSPAIRQHFSSDASALHQLPQIVVSPTDEQDVRKVIRFAWQLAEKGRVLPVVARGGGSDMSGAAIGQTIVLALQPHINKLREFDDKKGLIKVDAGANFGRVQHLLTFSHGRYIPTYPQSVDYATIGGAIANNSGGERSLRFGAMDRYVSSLQVVLANGDVIETGRISKKELSKKMGQPTFEGEVYRALDALLIENKEMLLSHAEVGRGTLGFNLKKVLEDDGSFDLTPLFVGSQGTLGIVIRAVLKTESYQPEESRLIITLKDRSVIGELRQEIEVDKPIVMEYIDRTMLQLGRQNHKGLLLKELGEEVPSGVLVVEYPELSSRNLGKLVKKYQTMFAEKGVEILEQTEDTQFVAERLKRLPMTLLAQHFSGSQLVPGIDDACLPPEKVHEFLVGAEQIFKKAGIFVAVHARAGEGIIHSYPLIDLTQLGDRQRLFRLIQDYYKLVLSFGGSVVGEHGAGRIRSVFVREQLGDVYSDIMHKVKQIFDPFGILNPGVKVDVDPKAALNLLGHEYGVSQLLHN